MTTVFDGTTVIKVSAGSFVGIQYDHETPNRPYITTTVTSTKRFKLFSGAKRHFEAMTGKAVVVAGEHKIQFGNQEFILNDQQICDWWAINAKPYEEQLDIKVKALEKWGKLKNRKKEK